MEDAHCGVVRASGQQRELPWVEPESKAGCRLEDATFAIATERRSTANRLVVVLQGPQI